jgi:hypothetical protein
MWDQAVEGMEEGSSGVWWRECGWGVKAHCSWAGCGCDVCSWGVGWEKDGG